MGDWEVTAAGYKKAAPAFAVGCAALGSPLLGFRLMTGLNHIP